MFYLIEYNYVGPNPSDDKNTDADTIEICTKPAYTNLSCELCIEGWAGTTGVWCVTAHGEYETLEKARAAITEKFGKTRECAVSGEPFDSDDTSAVEVHKPGEFEPMGYNGTASWAHEEMQDAITIKTTDAEISELVAQFEKAANEDGYTLHDALEDFMLKLRDDLLAEYENDQFTNDHFGV